MASVVSKGSVKELSDVLIAIPNGANFRYKFTPTRTLHPGNFNQTPRWRRRRRIGVPESFDEDQAHLLLVYQNCTNSDV
jgi:hypothetical protein